MIYVYKLPEKLANGYCYGGSVPITFENVDWMNSPSEMQTQNPISRDGFVKFIANKKYAKDRKPLMVVDTVDNYTMMIKFNPCLICKNTDMENLDICQACGRVELSL